MECKSTKHFHSDNKNLKLFQKKNEKPSKLYAYLHLCEITLTNQ